MEPQPGISLEASSELNPLVLTTGHFFPGEAAAFCRQRSKNETGRFPFSCAGAARCVSVFVLSAAQSSRDSFAGCFERTNTPRCVGGLFEVKKLRNDFESLRDFFCVFKL